MEDHTII